MKTRIYDLDNSEQTPEVVAVLTELKRIEVYLGKKILDRIPGNFVNKVKKELIDKLEDIKIIGDLADLGNEIGYIVGPHLGSNKESFIRGIKHGIDLNDK